MSSAIAASSVKDFFVNTALQAGSVIVAGSIRRARLPTISLCAFGIIQAIVSTTLMEGVKWVERRFGLIKNSDTENKTIELANYILCQVISIGLTYLIVQNVALLGLSLLYDMNPPSIVPYELGNVYCIVAQSTLVTLFVKAMKDLYEGMKERRLSISFS